MKKLAILASLVGLGLLSGCGDSGDGTAQPPGEEAQAGAKVPPGAPGEGSGTSATTETPQ
ncbi:MAG: hypothetical protein KIT11_03430 [Fimbriimonadaceae bacterium]|nr:hypothetical protein [Fimbriimonadaceae bacterium]QYK57051.1 MAG: hypothetical protein KF733_06095 [Fimbriimonadaceae bacterium]